MIGDAVRVLLAQTGMGGPENPLLQEAAKRQKSWLSGDTTLVLGAAAFIVLVLLFWVAFLRRRPTHRRGSLVVTRAKPGQGARTGASGRRRRRRRRPDHPDNFGRNPTLGETGGLPPLRPEDDVGPAPSATPGRPS